jgi:peroxiredoxin
LKDIQASTPGLPIEETMIAHKALSVFLLAAVTLAAAEDIPRPAPALEARTIDGRSISLSELKGKVVGVLFFLTDCPHCQQTTQSVLAPAYARMKSRGLEIIGMAINHPPVESNLKSFAKQFDVAFPLALSSTKEMYTFAGKSLLQRLGVPYLLLVDRQGRIRGDHPGRDRDFWLNQNANVPAAFEALLNEK